MAVVSLKQSAGTSRTYPSGLAFTVFATYRAESTATLLGREERAAMTGHALQTLASVPQVALRGTYDTSGYRADIDLLLWLAAPEPDPLQDALAAFRQTPLASMMTPVWSAVGVHRQSEAGRAGAPAYYRGESPRRYVSVSEVNHSAEWHALPVGERRRLQADADRVLRRYGDVLMSPVGAYGLGGCESLLALESHELGRIVDVVRDLGTAQNRCYLSGPQSFVTGVRKPLSEIVDALP